MRMTGDSNWRGRPPCPGKSCRRGFPGGQRELLRYPSYSDLAGTGFTRADRPGVPEVAVVNRTAARHYWGTQDPVGKRFSADNGQTWTQIVGVVGDVKQYGLDKILRRDLRVHGAEPLMDAVLVVKTKPNR